MICAEKDYREGAQMVHDMLLEFTLKARDGKPTIGAYIIVARKDMARN